MSPEVIEVCGLRFPVSTTASGTYARELERPLKALTLLLMHIVPGHAATFLDAVEHDAAFDKYPMFGFPVEADEDLEPARTTWRELTGQELGDDVYHIAAVWGPELYLPRATLVEIVRTFVALGTGTLDPATLAPREPTEPPSPWLFRRDAIGDEPHPDEQSVLRLVEEHALETDQLAALGGATGATKRRFLLAELDGYGLLRIAHGDARATWLERWRLPVLLGFQRATLEIARYWRSDARAKRLGVAPASDSVLGAAVSVDWFRHPVATPDGWDADDWLAFCERSLRDATLGEGTAGELYIHQGGFRGVIKWRRDDGQHAAVVSARVR